MTRMRAFVWCWGITLIFSIHEASAQTALATGDTTVTAKTADMSATVLLRIVAVSTDSPTLVGGRTEADPTTTKLVRNVTIDVNGQPVFASRSVYADLRDPRDAELRIRGGRGTLTVRGGDASESYRVVIEFNRTNVLRRPLYSGVEDSKMPTEDTTYRLQTLKDRP